MQEQTAVAGPSSSWKVAKTEQEGTKTKKKRQRAAVSAQEDNSRGGLPLNLLRRMKRQKTGTGNGAASGASSKLSPAEVAAKERRDEVKRRLRVEATREIRPLAIGTVAMVASAISNQAVPRLLGRVLDASSSSCTSQTCPAPSSMSAGSQQGGGTMSSLALVVLGGGAASFLRTTMLARAQDGIAARLRSKLFGVLLTDRDVEFFQSGRSGDGGAAEAGEEEADGGGEENGERMDVDATEDDKTTSSKTATSPGAIGSVLNDDVAKVSESLTATLANMIRSTCSVTFATGNMIRINSTLLTLSASVVPLIGTAAVVLNRFVRKVTARHREVCAAAASFAEERLAHVGTVKASCRESDEVERYAALVDESTRLGRSVSLARGSFMGFLFAASSGALFLVFSSGGKAVAEGRMTNGELTSFATYTFLLGLGTSGIVKASGELVQGLVCAERVYGLMDGCGTDGGGVGGGGGGADAGADGGTTDGETKAASASRGTTTSTSDQVDPSSVTSISLSNVSFSYRSNPHRTVLHDVSMTLRRGKVVALVGKNGSGKSTLASLLSALYKPQSGTITVTGGVTPPNGDDVDLHSLERRVQSSLVQAVPQHPALFDMSIWDNVTYSNPDASEEEVRSALRTANCDGFVSKLDGGVRYQVGRNGSKLSGGQRQRLALARALLSDPALLVLDEPTSSLDAEGETAVTDAVEACRGGSKERGLLLITHRAKTLELADEVVVLREGRIVERGPFVDLRGKKDSELCNLMPDLL